MSLHLSLCFPTCGRTIDAQLFRRLRHLTRLLQDMYTVCKALPKISFPSTRTAHTISLIRHQSLPTLPYYHPFPALLLSTSPAEVARLKTWRAEEDLISLETKVGAELKLHSYYMKSLCQRKVSRATETQRAQGTDRKARRCHRCHPRTGSCDHLILQPTRYDPIPSQLLSTQVSGRKKNPKQVPKLLFLLRRRLLLSFLLPQSALPQDAKAG